MLTLYYAPGSSSMASHLVLEEAGAHYETRFVDEEAGEQRKEAYLRANRRGKVPALRLPDGLLPGETAARASRAFGGWARPRLRDGRRGRGAAGPPPPCAAPSRPQSPRPPAPPAGPGAPPPAAIARYI